MTIYELEKEDLSGLVNMWDVGKVIMRDLFVSASAAKARADSDNGSPVDWTKSGGQLTSGDLGSHMYTITPIEVKSK
jgi:hypothetical protein